MKEQKNLATEIYEELKGNARKWRTAFCLMVGIEVFTVIVMLIKWGVINGL